MDKEIIDIDELLNDTKDLVDEATINYLSIEIDRLLKESNGRK